MKKLVVAVSCVMFYAFASGQARDGTLDLKNAGKYEPAALIYLPYAPQVVKDALGNYLEKTTKKDQQHAIGYLLSNNTDLAKSNIYEADMLFEIGVKDKEHVNETVVYLKLHSAPNTYSRSQPEFYFNMENAKDYLNNLAIAIKPYATQLQVQLQGKNLSQATAQLTKLTKQGNKLQKEKRSLDQGIAKNDAGKEATAKKKNDNQKKINENNIAQALQTIEVNSQKLSLTLLTDRSKN